MSSLAMLSAVCAVMYLLSFFILWRYTKRNNTKSLPFVVICSLLAAAIHGYLLYITVYTPNGINFSLMDAISMAAWISVALYVCTSLFQKTISLGMIILPIGLLGLLAGTLSIGQAFNGDDIPTGFGWHIILAIPTYGILCVAFAQACILIVQDRLLHKPSPGGISSVFPALETMELNLFWLTLSGFCLMTISLIMAMTSNLSHQGKLLEFNHHILLSLLAWAGFGCLMLGRMLLGWRGEKAAKWTIFTFGLLVLAYFGTRFVQEYVLGY